MRWTPSRKLAIIDQINKGELTVTEATEKYLISAEELDGWVNQSKRHGQRGLRSTRIQDYRSR